MLPECIFKNTCFHSDETDFLPSNYGGLVPDTAFVLPVLHAFWS